MVGSASVFLGPERFRQRIRWPLFAHLSCSFITVDSFFSSSDFGTKSAFLSNVRSGSKLILELKIRKENPMSYCSCRTLTPPFLKLRIWIRIYQGSDLDPNLFNSRKVEEGNPETLTSLAIWKLNVWRSACFTNVGSGSAFSSKTGSGSVFI